MIQAYYLRLTIVIIAMAIISPATAAYTEPAITHRCFSIFPISTATAPAFDPTADETAKATPTLADTSFFNYRDTFCSNQTLLIGNLFFDATNPNGIVFLPGAAADGGDSVILVNLVFRQPVEITLDQSICEGDTVWVNGTAYHSKFYLGEEIVDNGAANGCDSIIHINLNFYPTVLDYQATICEGDTIFINGTAYHAFHTSGEEMIPGAGVAGCDSLIRVQLEVLTPPFRIINDTLCPDGSLTINGHRFDRDNRTGLEILPGAAASGCDSLVYVSLYFRELWVYLGEDRDIVKGDTVCLTPLFGLVPESLAWYPAPPCADSLCFFNCIQPLTNVFFQLSATDTSGCTVSDDINIFVSNDNRVYAPNVFNPDAPEPNDRFFISTDAGVVLIRRLMIADRWGGIVYDQLNLTPGDHAQGWDGTWRGKIVQMGVYAFRAELERLDGTRFEKTGTVSLIR